MTDQMRICARTPSISSQVLYLQNYLMLVIKPVTLALGFTSKALYCTVLSDFKAYILIPIYKDLCMIQVPQPLLSASHL